jgi:ComF family protein
MFQFPSQTSPENNILGFSCRYSSSGGGTTRLMNLSELRIRWPGWREWLAGARHLLYPSFCLACDAAAPAVEGVLCVRCEQALPRTGYHELPDNPFTDRLWGRVPLEFGAAYLHFSTGGRVQRLIHHLKYYHRPEVGELLGRWYGRALRASAAFPAVDAIVPVPLHPRKQQVRGYNQAECFGRGLAESLELPLLPQGLHRTQHADSQTRQSRMGRFENIGAAFATGTADLRHRHILLVDDVLTTGATLEACAQPLLAVEGLRLSAVTIAIAS